MSQTFKIPQAAIEELDAGEPLSVLLEVRLWFSALSPQDIATLMRCDFNELHKRFGPKAVYVAALLHLDCHEADTTHDSAIGISAEDADKLRSATCPSCGELISKIVHRNVNDISDVYDDFECPCGGDGFN